MGLISGWKRCEATVPPTSPLKALRSEMDRLFDAYIREPISAVEWPFAGSKQWMPPVDLAETPTELVVRAELPGVSPDDLEVTVAGSYLVLAGDKPEPPDSGGQLFQTESRFGAFRRTVPLPQTVDPEQVSADYSRGVLVVRLKKVADSTGKRIVVSSK